MAPQDTYIDDEEDCCPLCIEEFDLSDRNFRPCPCGYQICQFCFNNIRNNMNGLCPACRRPYDDKTIQWKMVTQEEIAEFQRNIQKNQKKRAAEQRQREAQKREAEKENRKNLVGVRVVQKNLVYVTGLTPTVREEELLKSLRRHEFFGQYGNILKISISSRKGNDGQNQSLGVYVTFEKKEDAARCILAVNGSQNGDRILRAQLGTTKYCSAWLRHEQCTNRQCMFLHELGDEEDSYSRQDLSSMNSISSQRPIQNPGTSRSASRQQAHQSPAPALAQPMVRSSSKDGSDNGDAPALPPSANWARNPQVRSRRGSHATSGAAPSPAISSALPATAESAVEEASADSPAAGPSTKATPSANLSKPPTPPAQKAKRASQDALKSLLKSLESCSLKWPKLANEDELSKLYPPLFDSRGGMRRRAMRAAEDTSSVGDQQSGGAREASEGEPESSGSLALGGEPEDRDHSRDPHSYDPHRIAQPPIQRSNTEGLFGQAVGASFTAQATANLGSVGARTMTPQQPAFMRQPGAFVDHLSAQANLFQGQGHNRQGSRFSFANDGRDAASATSVKLTANPRIMAQQSSMMPSSFHNQPGSQYYASSMPGPPPGLKSTGTPPGVFGQHGFGSAAFGGASKDSNEILQLFGRGRAAGTQAHEAVKRELMFYPFPNQYPPSTSSTPAPASSRLAMLYGSQPGAFQDLGSKQKKKGKKHRHANTSSSGGSGSADLADPSILQATRMQSQQHLQQQSNAALGQGLFGGQSQDDDLLAMDEVRTSIEALVADEPIDANIRQPPGTFEPFGRLKTPSVPPGLGLPNAHPSPAVSHSSLQATSTGRHTPPVALPKVPVKPPVATVSSPLSGKKTIAQPVTEAKKNIKALAAESGLSKEINSKAKSQKLLQDEEFPALGSPKPQRAATPVVQPKAPAGKAASAGSKKPAEKTKDVDTAKEEPVSAPARGETPKPVARAAEKIPEKTAEKKVEKRPVPGILNIAAATKAAQMKNAEAQSTDKSAADRDSAFPALPTPTAASVSSPLARTAPKTLRVVSTPKTETPSTPVNGPASILAAPVARAVAAAAIRPETPASELISDSASIISASISASRTNSPPPSKIGSAPMRATTKSQQRKQRKEALKKEAATISAQPAKAEPAEIAPIIGRKKKQKKDKPNSRNATPTESSSENPLAPQTMPADEVKENDEVKDAKEVKEVKEVKEIKEVKEVREVKEESSTYRSTANETTTLTDEPHNRYGDLKGKMAEARKNLDHSTTPRIMPTPAAVLRDLQEAGLVSGNIDDLAFLKSVSAQLDKWKNDPNNAGLRDLAARNTMTPTKSIVTEDDQTALMAGNPVRKVVDGVRILLTPNGDCVRNLSPEEEDRFLELQQLVATSITNPAAFVSPRHEAGGGFSLIKGRAVPNGPPSYFPPGPGAYPSDPVNKIQREEAIYYINQYVLPRLNLNARDMSLPKAMSSWTTDPRGTAAQAAANLSSVAPWLYGGISPSSHGADVDVDVTADAAAPELNYPGPIGAFADPLHHIPHHLQPHSHPHFPHPGFAPYLDLPNGSPGSQPPLADEIRDSSANSGNNTNASTNKSPMSYHSPGPFGNVPLMSLEDAEQALAAARKETEKLEKSLNQLMKKNRKLLLSMAGGAASSASPTATAVLAGGAASGGGGH